MPGLLDLSAPTSANEEVSAEVRIARQEVLAELQRIANSGTFAKSVRLTSLLSYIVERSISDRSDELTEQQIGIQVFGRSPGYNSGDDNIVRGSARALRQKLSNYYLTEGMDDRIRIEIPKGGYTARFETISTIAPETAPAPPTEELKLTDKPFESGRPLFPKWIFVVVLSGLILLLVIAAVASQRLHSGNRSSAGKIPSSVLWTTLFSADRNTFLVPGDAGLHMYATMEHKLVSIEDYSRGFHLQPDNKGEYSPGVRYARHPYTTLADTQLIGRLMQRPEAAPGRVQVRFARDLNTADLRSGSNLILLGSESYNPWIQIFGPQLDLKFSQDVTKRIFNFDNPNPQAGEPKHLQWVGGENNGRKGIGMTFIALTNNPRGEGRVLLIEGTTLSGIFAASDFLMNPKLLDPVIARATRADGTLCNFEVLLQWNFIREGVDNLHVAVEHVHN